MLAANNLHRLFFPHPPSGEEKQGIIFPWEIWSVWGFPHLLVLEAPGGRVCEGTAWSRARAALSVSVVLPSGSSRVRIKAGHGAMTELFCCSFWDSKVCFGSMLQQKEKLLNVVCNISVCWNTSFWTAWVRSSQAAARCKNGWGQLCARRADTGLYFVCPPFFFNTALLASEKMTFSLCWQKLAT